MSVRRYREGVTFSRAVPGAAARAPALPGLYFCRMLPAKERAGGLRMSRRALLQAGMIAGAGAAALPLLELAGRLSREYEGGRAGLVYSLNADWLFGGQYTSGSESTFYDDSGFAPVTLPHTVTQLSWRDWDPGAWQQVWIYRRHLDGRRLVSPRQPGDRIFADFDGVMADATVVINDKAVATHRGGYLPFSAELTGEVTPGDNLLAVIVDSRCVPVPPVGAGLGPGSIDYLQPGGIYRDVRLRVVPRAFLSDLFALPRDVLGPRPQVDVEYSIDSALAGRATGTVLVELLDGPRPVAARAAAVSLTSPGVRTGRLTLAGLGPVTLWSTENPKLYTVRATLAVPGVGRHAVTRRIGFREASFRPDGFYLNGRRLQLSGLNRHQLFPYAGMAMPERVQRRDAEILKNELNCTMVRCSHYPQSPHFLDACDELGLLVWEEAPGWHHVTTTPGWEDLVIADVRDMVIRDRSRPSVVIWGTRLNETRNYPELWAATRRAAAELGGDGRPLAARLGRGRLRLQRLRRRPRGRRGEAAAAVPRPAVPGHRDRRRGGRQAAALRLDRPAGTPRQAGGAARPGAEPGALRAGIRRGARLGRVRLRLAAGGARRGQVGRGGGPVPGAQAGRRHLPVAAGPRRPAGHRARVLLGAGRGRPRPGRDGRQQLRTARDRHRRQAGGGRAARPRLAALRPPALPALPGALPGVPPGRTARAADPGLRGRPAGGAAADVVGSGRRLPRPGRRRRGDRRGRVGHDQGGLPRARQVRQPAQA